MNNKVQQSYEAPEVEIIEVKLEKGFAASIDDMPYGGSWG
jgi:hypothetical protein